MGALCCCCGCCRKKDQPEPIFKEDKDRKCTDVLCLLLFLVFWCGMAAIAAVGFSQVRSGLLGRYTPPPPTVFRVVMLRYFFYCLCERVCAAGALRSCRFYCFGFDSKMCRPPPPPPPLSLSHRAILTHCFMEKTTRDGCVAATAAGTSCTTPASLPT